MPLLPKAKGFTLIELLIVIAILGILAAAVLVAINPAKRLRQARDAKRKQDINAITNALIGYNTLTGNYPSENVCDSSKGWGDILCPPGGNDWSTDSRSYIYQALVVSQGFLKKLPIDPINDSTYYYMYEPYAADNNFCGPLNQPCAHYWIGVILEAPDMGGSNVAFRCTDDTINFPAGPGCKEVDFGSAPFNLNLR